MNFNDLRSVVSSKKLTFEMETAADSFRVCTSPMPSYVEPSFSKLIFDEEKPTFLLISAVGASGKSMLGRRLSLDSGLPVLDLGLHPPVADNTLTGLLTKSYPISSLTAIFSAIRAGEFGVIIDGVDEGRSKTNEKAFEAFLNDLIKLSQGSTRTSFVLLGRTKTLEDCWAYLTETVSSVGIISLDPFSMERAQDYIDRFAEPPKAGQIQSYIESRDLILSRLSDAFSGSGSHFLSFIGYPPVLDAVATLLREEKNYHKLSTEMGDGSGSGGEVEKRLLYRIAAYITERERVEKVFPNLVRAISADLAPEENSKIRDRAYNEVEQCARLIAHCLGEPLSMEVFHQGPLNARYEDGLSTFLNRVLKKSLQIHSIIR